MNTNQTELWQRLEQFQLDEAQVAFPFTARLARENGWSRALALRVALEYKRFAFLCVAAGHPCTPSEQVDQAWHLHLIYTRSYWEEFCRDALRQPLHHGPTKGGAKDGAKFHDWYARTLESYRHFFGEPPADIWPPAAQRFGEDLRVERVNVARHWVIAKPRWWPAAKVAALLGAGGVAVAGCQGALLGYVPVFDWKGPEFLKFYAVMFGIALGWIFWRFAAWSRAQNERAAQIEVPSDVYEIAALTGGTERMAQAAVVSLANTGTISLGGEGGKQLQVSGPLPETAHPVERSVYEKLLGQEAMPARAAVCLVAELTDLQQVANRQPGAGEFPSRPPIRMMLPLGLVFVMGVTKLIIGLSREKPVGFLVLMLLGTAITAVLVQIARHKTKSWQQRLQQQLQLRSASLRQDVLGAEGTSHAGSVLALTAALFGVGALSNTMLADYVPLLAPPPLPPRRVGSEGGSGCGSDGGSSGGDGGGGGGCGGGGCGGCGGGGD
jgi:uncharacterized protein (TIGR04222 family)